MVANMPDLGWSAYIAAQEEAAEWDYLVKMHDEMTELSEYPTFTDDAIKLRKKIAHELLNQMMGCAILNSHQMTEAMLAIGARVGEDGVRTWDELCEIAKEEIAKREPSREEIEKAQ
jgi:hypothetical protein